MRLDLYISQKFNISRNKAQFAIQEKKITVDWKIIQKSSFEVDNNSDVKILDDQEIKYVARSALKLKWLLENLNKDFKNYVCIDVWSSTWWFCQILLENDVSQIFAIDVGTSQLHDILRKNPKIISIENTDIRNLEKSKINKKIDLITCDVSFISLNLIIDKLLELWDISTKYILLFKPQFEVWSENISKLWVVKDKNKSQNALTKFCDYLRSKLVKNLKIINSCLKWENWNQEIFIYFEK